MPIEYFETEPTKKKQPPDFLDRVIDVTEHHEHAVKEEDSTPAWNSCIYSCDLQQYKQRIETQQWPGRLYVKACTPTMTVVADPSGFEYRISYAPSGGSSTLVTITAYKDGRDCSEDFRDTILKSFTSIGNFRPQPQAVRVRSRGQARPGGVKSLLWPVGVIALILWILAISGGLNPSPATPAQASPTPTATPIVQKTSPHKAVRGRQR